MATPPRAPRSGRAGSKLEDVRRHNLGTLLSHLHVSGPLTRAELTARMELNRSTIGDLVSRLIELGVVEQERPAGGQVGAGAGRPSLLVRPRPEGAQVLAVDVQVDRAVVGLVGLGGVVVTRRSRRLTRPRSAAAVAAVVRRLVENVLADPAAGRRVVGMGVALPGVVRHDDGCVRFAPNLGWVDEPFGRLLQAEVADLPGGRVRVGNDADLGVLAEHLRGAAVGQDDVVFLSGSVGVGGGCITGGVPLGGAGGYAGEFGHLPLVPDGRPCRCGARGCWETELGAPAVARALGQGDAGVDDVLLALRRAARDEAGRARVDGLARWLGLGLACVVNLLNPRLIIVDGLLREVLETSGDVVRDTLRGSALAAPAEQVVLVPPRLGDDAVLVGASELAWQDLLADPAGTLCEASAPLSVVPGTMPG